MNGIAEILSSGQCPGLIISSGKTEQRKLEDEAAKGILKLCSVMEDRDGSRMMDGAHLSRDVVKHVWESELSDARKNSITERYDDRMARIEEAAERIPTE